MTQFGQGGMPGLQDRNQSILLFLLVVLMTFSVAHDYLGEEKPRRIEWVGGVEPPKQPARLGDPGWSGWIRVPAGFRRFETHFGREAFWNSSRLSILGGRYTVAVGPFEFRDPDDGKFDYFSIDVESPREDASYVVGELSFPLAYVSEEKIRAPAGYGAGAKISHSLARELDG